MKGRPTTLPRAGQQSGATLQARNSPYTTTNLSRFSLFTVCALATSSGACGGNVSSSAASSDAAASDVGVKDSSPSDSTGPTDSGAPVDVADAEPDGEPWSPVCPETAPSVGSSCSQAMLSCEYGDAWWNVACDTVLVCSQGQWGLAEVGGSPCLGKPGPNPPGCPTNAAYIAVNSACPDAGLTCNYLQGVVCQCLADHVSVDAGPYWDCVPASNCPTTRPRIGAQCSGTAGCTYELCSYAEICASGIWQPLETMCN